MSEGGEKSFMKSNITEYIASLLKSKKYGPQVVCHKIFPEKTARFEKSDNSLSDAIKSCLSASHITHLYSHQKKSLNLVKEDHDIIVATPTASGKSMIYNIPVLQELEKKPDSHALYLFPLKALAQDQLKTLESFILPSNVLQHYQPIGEIYDGDTSTYKRRKIREQPPPVIMTNPEMLHLSLLPHHESWAHFFKRLKYVVIDEVHTYRGVFGSHMAWVLRRLERIVKLYGASPQFILLSATIGNPAQLGEKLVNRAIQPVVETGAPQPKKHMVLLNPWDSAAYAASQLLEAAIKRGLRTIVYTQSRKMTELITMWTQPKLGDLKDKLSSYRAGFLPEERREIEGKLSDGSLLGVISTSALELGIDIGDLDLCILVGFPGSMMATYQRGGRVGRANRESAVILIAQEDALDQYFMRNSEDFFSRNVETAIVNPENQMIIEKHLECAAAELPLTSLEPLLGNPKNKEVVKLLCQKATLFEVAEGDQWFAARKRPQRHVSLRGGGSQATIVCAEDGVILGEIDTDRAMKECHQGAIYIHRAKTWYVEKLDVEGREIIVTPFTGKYFTRPITNKNTDIIKVTAQKKVFGANVSFGKLVVREKVTGFQKKRSVGHKLISTNPLDLPEQIMETEGLWVELPTLIKEEFQESQLHFMGAIHALEHAMIAMFPLLVLCDRNDIGGISCPIHEQTRVATVFIYDGQNGGAGLAREAFQHMEQLLIDTSKVVSSCTCENGCPSCVHSPKCGSGNRPIDKNGCILLLDKIIDEDRPVQESALPPGSIGFDTSRNSESSHKVSGGIIEEGEKRMGLAALPVRYGVFDIETKKSAQEVGGWNRAEKMGLSVGVVWDSQLQGCVTYLEHEVDRLIAHLLSLDLVVGFNNKRFDNQVLSAYTKVDLHGLPTLDILEEIHNYLGYRLSLDRLAETTLGVNKTGDGLLALQWFKEGKIDEICKYCKRDVEITRDLFHFGVEEGHFLFVNKAGKTIRLPLNMEKTILSEVEKGSE